MCFGCHQHSEAHYRRRRPILKRFLLHCPSIVSHGRLFSHERKYATPSLFPGVSSPHLSSRLVFGLTLRVLVFETVVGRNLPVCHAATAVRPLYVSFLLAHLFAEHSACIAHKSKVPYVAASPLSLEEYVVVHRNSRSIATAGGHRDPMLAEASLARPYAWYVWASQTLATARSRLGTRSCISGRELPRPEPFPFPASLRELYTRRHDTVRICTG